MSNKHLDKIKQNQWQWQWHDDMMTCNDFIHSELSLATPFAELPLMTMRPPRGSMIRSSASLGCSKSATLGDITPKSAAMEVTQPPATYDMYVVWIYRRLRYLASWFKVTSNSYLQVFPWDLWNKKATVLFGMLQKSWLWLADSISKECHKLHKPREKKLLHRGTTCWIFHSL